MGREVTGVRVEQIKSAYAKVKPKVSADTDREVNLKSPEVNKEVKDCEVKECTSEAPRTESSPQKQEVLAIKSTNIDSQKMEMKPGKSEGQKSSSPAKPSNGTAVAEDVKIKNTPQEPSDVAIDKQVCESPIAVETPVSPSGSNTKSPSSAKKSQPSTPHVMRRLLDDEDNWSMTSSTAASVRTTKSRTTVGVAPTFTVTERLEKRKEYYAKLEEKRKALEAEKREYEARTKEEEEAAIRQLRKNMKFKANPVPNFYYKEPPPKRELKKLPTTRAVSPKFGRRKSCSDAIRPPSEETVSGRSARHSLGGRVQKAGSTPTSTPKKKENLVGSTSKSKDRLKAVKETKETPPKTTNPDIAVQS